LYEIREGMLSLISSRDFGVRSRSTHMVYQSSNWREAKSPTPYWIFFLVITTVQMREPKTYKDSSSRKLSPLLSIGL
jgi:hypothetical protein